MKWLKFQIVRPADILRKYGVLFDVSTFRHWHKRSEIQLKKCRDREKDP